jgi:cytochrome c nitrite reductase small subunit
MSPAKKTILLYVLLAAVIVAGLGIFAAFGPPGLYAKSESPEFCGSCHVLKTQYETWFHSGAHASIKCIDCHLPNNNFPNHLLWKTLDGVKDWVKFHTGMVSEPIRISTHGAHVVQANCQRCHADLLARVKIERQCWDCHRRKTHQHTGAIATVFP